MHDTTTLAFVFLPLFVISDLFLRRLIISDVSLRLSIVFEVKGPPERETVVLATVSLSGGSKLADNVSAKVSLTDCPIHGPFRNAPGSQSSRTKHRLEADIVDLSEDAFGSSKDICEGLVVKYLFLAAS